MEASRSSSKDLALLIAFVVIASLDSAFKYTGFAGLAVYSVGASAFLFIYFTYVYHVVVVKVSLGTSIALAVAGIIGLCILAFLLYDLANSGRIGPGSDGDDALMLGAAELISGRYPFYPRTYLANPIAPMPGAIILSIPFVLLGIYPLQAVFWLIAFFLTLAITTGNMRGTLLMALPILAVSPTIFQNISAGTDHIPNSVYILIFSLLVIRAGRKDSARWWEFAIPAVLLGVGLSSRSNFAFLVPMLVVLLWKLKGYRVAFGTGAVICGAAVAATLPFWLYDPQGFTPLIVQKGKMEQFNGIIPQAGIVLAVSALSLALGLSARKRSSTPPVFFQNLAFVQLFILIFTSTLYSIWIGEFNLYFGHVGYGLFVMFFGVFAQWTKIAATRMGMDSQP
jgi:hypothetical protein